MIPLALEGKRALVMGVTNKYSLGWAIANKLHEAGATMAFSYQGERLRADLEALTAHIPDAQYYQADVRSQAETDALFAALAERWGSIDYVVHAIAFAPRPALEGRYIDTTREDWATALEISCFSLVSVAKAAEPLMSDGGALVTLTYYASERVVPRYNVMGVAKAALEASVRYLAYDMGPKGIRVNAVSAGPVKTVAARSIPGFLKMLHAAADAAPLHRNVLQDEVGNLGLFLLSPMASGITGETVYVDCGYNVMGMDLEK